MLPEVQPVPVVQATETHTHIVGDETVTFEAWTDTTSLPTDGKAYYLNDNVNISDVWEPADGTMLDLNGKTITRIKGATSSHDYVILVTGGATVTLYDCSEGNTGKIKNTLNLANGVVLNDDSPNNIFNMYGGNISYNSGRGVYVRKGATFNMYGGSISYNTSTFSSGGGGVEIAGYDLNGTKISGVFNMYGGSISNNYLSSGNGGGVYVSGAAIFNMSGGDISNNTAASSNGNGGGVFVGTYSAYEENSSGIFNMTGGSITNNTAGKLGGGVYVERYYNDTNTARFTVSGKPTITGNSGSNVYLPDVVTFAIGKGGLESGAKIGVRVENTLTGGQSVSIATGADNGYADDSIFTDSKGLAYLVRRIDNKIMLLGSSSAHVNHNERTFEHKLSMKNNKPYIDSTTELTYNPNSLCYELPAGSYYLSGDLTLDHPLILNLKGGYVFLCLNGHSITQTGNNDVIVINDGMSSLFLYDCSGDSGQITHAKNKTGRGVKFWALAAMNSACMAAPSPATRSQMATAAA